MQVGTLTWARFEKAFDDSSENGCGHLLLRKTRVHHFGTKKFRGYSGEIEVAFKPIFFKPNSSHGARSAPTGRQ